MSEISAIYQIKITLKWSKPPIWRRVLVPANATLGDLHQLIQLVMGWAGYHLHIFTVEDLDYGVPSPDDWRPVRDERRFRLDRLNLAPKSRFYYEYDFGDSWVHQLLVEKALEADPEVQYPVCVTGRRAAPPDDVGGIPGYEMFVQAMQDPTDPEHEHYLEWYGGPFDPEAFDLRAINEALRRFAKRRRKR
jgi:hypothetical protein